MQRRQGRWLRGNTAATTRSPSLRQSLAASMPCWPGARHSLARTTGTQRRHGLAKIEGAKTGRPRLQARPVSSSGQRQPAQLLFLEWQAPAAGIYGTGPPACSGGSQVEAWRRRSRALGVAHTQAQTAAWPVGRALLQEPYSMCRSHHAATPARGRRPAHGAEGAAPARVGARRTQEQDKCTE